MNWKAIKHIYRSVLIERAKIKYIGEDKYIITRFHSSGEKWTKTEYKNGLTHGKCLGWYESGSKHWEIGYKNAKLHGKYAIWLENGIKDLETEHRNGIHIKT